VIRIAVVVDRHGAVARLEMSGHASAAAGPKGGNTVCAGVTAVVRSCAEAIAERAEIASTGGATEGALHVEVTGYPDSCREWLCGVTSVLLSGAKRIADEAPGEVELRQETEGEQYGS